MISSSSRDLISRQRSLESLSVGRNMHLSKATGPASSRDLIFFHSLLKACVEGANPSSPISIFRHLLRSDPKPTHLTLSLLLKAFVASSPSSLSHCASINPFKLQVCQVQTHLVKSGLDQFVYVKTALLDLYTRLGCLSIARWLFDEMPERDVVVWNALIRGYSHDGHDCDALNLFIEMLKQGFSPTTTTLVCLLPCCGQRGLLSQGKCTHALAAKVGLESDSQVKNALASMYSKCLDLESAELLFAEMNQRSIVSWNTMIGAYGQNGLKEEAMLVFSQMCEENVEINSVAIVSLLSAEVSHEPLHCFVTKSGLVNDASVVTSLVCAYARCGNSESAESLFMSATQKNIVGLTAIISSFAEKGNMDVVVAYVSRMLWWDMKFDAVAMVSILHGFMNSSQIGPAFSLHGYAIKSGLCTHSLVANGLITMYSKFDDVEAILSLFEKIHEKPLVSWNSVISGCIQAGRARKALEVFHQMKLSGGPAPDAITIASLLTGCSQLGYLHFGKKLHCYTLRNNFEREDFVCTALVDMYAKCGEADVAEIVFKNIRNPCLATWNAMISGYSLSGLQDKALSCYLKMQKRGVKPDKITFLGVLAACTHGGLVDEGKRYFHAMTKDFGITPSLQHCAFMVGLLGRAGLFREALSLIAETEVEPDSAVWGALLSACCVHGETKLGEYVAKKMYLLDYRNGGLYVLMSNLYAAEGMWDNAARVRQMMKDNGGDGYSGVSLVE